MELNAGWELASAPPGLGPGDDELSALDWRDALVPGTAAAAAASGDGEEGRDYDAEDWWFRCRFALPEGWLGAPISLELEGIATVSETFLNGTPVLASESMWAGHEVDVSAHAAAENELLIACRALGPRMARRRRPAARWRTRVVNAGHLRWYRTMIFGRSPGFAPGPAPVGPWRPVRLRRRDQLAVTSLAIRPRCEGKDGVVTVTVSVQGAWQTAQARIAGGETQELRQGSSGELAAELRLPGAARWWPHTHGFPALHELEVELDGAPAARRRVGFRELGWPADPVTEGLSLTVNGVGVFARGVVWTPADLVTLAPDPGALRVILERVRDAGMNMVRVVGTGAYEPPAFHELCDELGILVWQDLMFANLDYPVSDPEFAAGVEQEASAVIAELAGRPSLAVLCGNSEVEQQPAMMGLDPGLGRHELWEETIPARLAAAGADCAYLRSTPCGGTLPFHPDGGATHYFGVSGYMLPLSDLRRADVRFASECLAFANVPDEVDHPVHHPRWKQGVPRDAGTGWDIGAGWDFDDVRDAYLAQLYGVDPVGLRRYDHARYLELSRAVSGEVMAAAMGEWRRPGSKCRGALVLWLKDMLPGAGLGVLDHRGEPKAAYHYLRRALAPTAVWMTDEGVGGVAVHVAHDRGEPLAASLRLGLYRDGETCVGEAEEALELGPHAELERSVEGLLGRFLDPAWCYRFGPPTAHAIVASLAAVDGRLLSQAFFFPAGRPLAPEPAEQLGITASAAAREGQEGGVSVELAARRLVYGVRLDVPDFTAQDGWFSLEPGHTRTVLLQPAGESAAFRGGALAAINLQGRVELVSEV